MDILKGCGTAGVLKAAYKVCQPNALQKLRDLKLPQCKALVIH